MGRSWVLGVALLAGCEPVPCEQQWGYYTEQGFGGYRVEDPETTPNGIVVDRGGQDVRLEVVDRYASRVRECLAKLGPEDAAGAGCSNPGGDAPFSVVVARDWLTSPCSGEQVLPVNAGEAGCWLKKQSDPRCPCRYRAGISCPNTLVVTPNLKLLGDVEVRYLWGCRNPWAAPALAACAGISTVPPGENL